MRLHNILLQNQFNLSKFCFVLYSIKDIVVHGLGITNLSFEVHPGKSRAFVQEYLPLSQCGIVWDVLKFECKNISAVTTELFFK